MRSILLPLEGREAHFSGLNRGRSTAGHLLLAPIEVGGRRITHIYFCAIKNIVEHKSLPHSL
jgi:hypothetical protein